jgi:hypothetical protein
VGKVEASDEEKLEVVSHIAELVSQAPANTLIIIYTYRKIPALNEGPTVGSFVFDPPLGCGNLPGKFWYSRA